MKKLQPYYCQIYNLGKLDQKAIKLCHNIKKCIAINKKNRGLTFQVMLAKYEK